MFTPHERETEGESALSPYRVLYFSLLFYLAPIFPRRKFVFFYSLRARARARVDTYANYFICVTNLCTRARKVSGQDPAREIRARETNGRRISGISEFRATVT